MRLILMLSALAFVAAPATAYAPCKDAKGKFIKCPISAAKKPVRCKDARGKFVKCGTAGAKPA